MKRLKISKLYGPVPQGEGPTAGRPRVFLRTALCDLKCSWCDSPETWDWQRFSPEKEIQKRSLDSLAEAIILRAERGGPGCGLVITGGEPMIQKTTLTTLLQMLPKSIIVEVETNGLHAPNSFLWERVDAWNVSPKLANSGNPDHRRELNQAWVGQRPGARKVIGKFVVEDPSELDEVQVIADRMKLWPWEVWIMPQAIDVLGLSVGLRKLEHHVLSRGWNMSGRNQVVAWGSERGH